ncbi:hypothetical protein ScPMuIL_006858 [Solemya velum]
MSMIHGLAFLVKTGIYLNLLHSNRKFTKKTPFLKDKHFFGSVVETKPLQFREKKSMLQHLQKSMNDAQNQRYIPGLNNPLQLHKWIKQPRLRIFHQNW